MRHLRVLAALLAVTLLPACSAVIPAGPGAIPNVEVVEEHHLQQDQAFSRLLRWAAETYNSANDVVQLQDRETGAIVVKGATSPSGSTLTMFYTMSMDVRDGRVRFRQSAGDVRGRTGGSDYMSRHDAELLNRHFAALRASALAALRSTDTF